MKERANVLKKGILQRRDKGRFELYFSKTIKYN